MNTIQNYITDRDKDTERIAVRRNTTIHRCQIFFLNYLIFYKEVEHVDGQLPLRAILDGKLQDFCLDFGLLGLGRLVRLLLCLTLLWRGLGREGNSIIKTKYPESSALHSW